MNNQNIILGVKCHSYRASNCGDSTDIGGGTVQCLSGIGSCGVVKAGKYKT